MNQPPKPGRKSCAWCNCVYNFTASLLWSIYNNLKCDFAQKLFRLTLEFVRHGGTVPCSSIWRYNFVCVTWVWWDCRHHMLCHPISCCEINTLCSTTSCIHLIFPKATVICQMDFICTTSLILVTYKLCTMMVQAYRNYRPINLSTVNMIFEDLSGLMKRPLQYHKSKILYYKIWLKYTVHFAPCSHIVTMGSKKI